MLLLIDLSTLRRNPEYRSGLPMVHRVAGPATWYKTLIIKIKGGWRRVEWVGTSAAGPWVKSATAELTLDGGEYPLPDAWVTGLRCEQDVREIFDIGPSPEWLYSYEDPVITTECCARQVKVSELQTESWESAEDYGWTTTKCPKCGDWEAITLTRESVEAAQKRQQAAALGNLAAVAVSS